MNWNLEGKKVTGKYLGEFSFTGVVSESRVKYGGAVSNTVVLDEPIVVFSEPRIVVLQNTDELTVI